MSIIYLFEAGSTKTSLLVHTDSNIEEFSFSGYNPNRSNGIFEKELEGLKIEKDAKVFFYGSGLGSEQNKKIVKELFYNLHKTSIVVYDDLLGAARAAFSSNQGVVAIMGTGGIVAYYNGVSIEDRRGGYGYLIDDLGGGYELGKRMVSMWLNGDLGKESSDLIEKFIGFSKKEFIADYYIQPDLLVISEIPRLLENVKSKKLDNLSYKYFLDFFETHVTNLLKTKDLNKISLVGGIAKKHENLLIRLTESLRIEIEEVIVDPNRKLLDFHLKNQRLFEC